VTVVDAPPAAVFDAARDIDLHVRSLARTREHPVGGVTSGLISGGESVTWRARYFGRWWTLRSRIDAFEPPHRFRDVVVSGPFAHYEHDHLFEARENGTAMMDVVDYAAPFGPLGRFAESLFLDRTVFAILSARAAAIRAAVERD